MRGEQNYLMPQKKQVFQYILNPQYVLGLQSLNFLKQTWQQIEFQKYQAC